MREKNLLYQFQHTLHTSNTVKIYGTLFMKQSIMGVLIKAEAKAEVSLSLKESIHSIHFENCDIHFEPTTGTHNDYSEQKHWHTACVTLNRITQIMDTFFCNCKGNFMNLTVFIPVNKEEYTPDLQTFTLRKSAKKTIPGYVSSVLYINKVSENVYKFTFSLHTENQKTAYYDKLSFVVELF